MKWATPHPDIEYLMGLPRGLQITAQHDARGSRAYVLNLKSKSPSKPVAEVSYIGKGSRELARAWAEDRAKEYST